VLKGNTGLLQSEGKWRTRMGGFVYQERVILRDKELHRDLGEMSWMEVYLYGITGRTFTQTELKILNAIWVHTSYPDPRIWNNRVAALAGTVRSTGALGVGAAIAVSDTEIFGGLALTEALKFFIKAQEMIVRGDHLVDIVAAEIAKKRIIFGYGRPKASMDERVESMLSLMEKLDFTKGTYFDLAFEIEQVLRDSGKLIRMNYGALVAALCADIGFSANQFNMFMVPLFLAGFPPCFIDASEHSEASLFPLRCEQIDYLGTEKRTWD